MNDDDRRTTSFGGALRDGPGALSWPRSAPARVMRFIDWVRQAVGMKPRYCWDEATCLLAGYHGVARLDYVTLSLLHIAQYVREIITEREESEKLLEEFRAMHKSVYGFTPAHHTLPRLASDIRFVMLCRELDFSPPEEQEADRG